MSTLQTMTAPWAILILTMVAFPAPPVLAQNNSVSPFILYGPHGYGTYSHSRCQEVPTVNVSIDEVHVQYILFKNTGFILLFTFPFLFLKS